MGKIRICPGDTADRWTWQLTATNPRLRGAIMIKAAKADLARLVKDRKKLEKALKRVMATVQPAKTSKKRHKR